MAETVVGRYLEAVRDQDDDPELPYLAPQPKHYPGAPVWPLPWPVPAAPASQDDADARLGAVLLAFAPCRVDMVTVAALAALKGTVSGAPRAVFRSMPGWLTLRSAVASGGAFHPTEIYLAWGGSPRLPAGVYHYHPLRHALTQLRRGQVAGLPGGAAHALLLTHRPWKNVSKYHAFGYRLGVIDSGVVLGQTTVAPAAATICLAPDPGLSTGLLGLDPLLESVYAVVGLDIGPTPAAADDSGATRVSFAADGAEPPRQAGMGHDVTGRDYADPRTVALHQAVLAAHTQVLGAAPDNAGFEAAAATARRSRGMAPDHAGSEAAAPTAQDRGVAVGNARPEVGAVHAQSLGVARDSAGAEGLPVLDLWAATADRASAANLGGGLTVWQLEAILAHAAGVVGSGKVFAAQQCYPDLWCAVDNVDGLAPGAYRYDPRRHLMLPTRDADAANLGEALPHNLHPRMATAGATLYAVSPPGCRLESLAAADFHRLHLLTGVAAQLAGLAAAAVGAAGRVLGGMSEQAVAARLGLPAQATPLLQMVLGLPAIRPGSLTVHLREGG